jgi:hypothetical protein
MAIDLKLSFIAIKGIKFRLLGPLISFWKLLYKYSTLENGLLILAQGFLAPFSLRLG